ncbi:MAG: hypothetical protein U0736_19055 [Gemmataceae bacterium]
MRAPTGCSPYTTTLSAYMRQWFTIYNSHFPPVLIPVGAVGCRHAGGTHQVQRDAAAHFPPLEAAQATGARPLLMIHGDQDYIKTDIARAVFDRATEPKEFWLVANAKHNQAMHIAGDEYHDRVLSSSGIWPARNGPLRCCADARPAVLEGVSTGNEDEPRGGTPPERARRMLHRPA